jgi:hypothetical protein
MKIIITEEQFSRFNRSNSALQNGIVKYLNLLIENGKRTFSTKNNNLGNLSEDWCIDGKNSITAVYYFEDGEFDSAHLIISKDIIDRLTKVFSIKKSYAAHVFEEWYDEVMVPKFEDLVNESGLYIDNISVVNKDYPCKIEHVRPEDLTDDEMIDYIVAHTLFKRQDVIRQIENGRDLDVFYFDVKDRENDR